MAREWCVISLWFSAFLSHWTHLESYLPRSTYTKKALLFKLLVVIKKTFKTECQTKDRYITADCCALCYSHHDFSIQ